MRLESVTLGIPKGTIEEHLPALLLSLAQLYGTVNFSREVSVWQSDLTLFKGVILAIKRFRH